MKEHKLLINERGDYAAVCRPHGRGYEGRDLARQMSGKLPRCRLCEALNAGGWPSSHTAPPVMRRFCYGHDA